tara:strand:- start:3623 stop:4405 length:783 start_codon:yes stop_codon:yes gene_type:complete
MNRTYFSVGVVFLGLLFLGIAYLRHEGKPVSNLPSLEYSGSNGGSAFRGDSGQPFEATTFVKESRAKVLSLPGEREIDSLRRQLEATTKELDRLSRPLNSNVLSSTVNAEIEKGESLVSGGYQMSDGSYELTFITPKSIVLADRGAAIEVNSRVISIGDSFMKANGLGTLATNARNTLQHAEAWQQDDVEATLASLPEYGGSSNVSEQRTTVLPSVPFQITMGDPNGLYYTLDATVEESLNGGYLIQSRIERSGDALQSH